MLCDAWHFEALHTHQARAPLCPVSGWSPILHQAKGFRSRYSVFREEQSSSHLHKTPSSHNCNRLFHPLQMVVMQPWLGKAGRKRRQEHLPPCLGSGRGGKQPHTPNGHRNQSIVKPHQKGAPGVPKARPSLRSRQQKRLPCFLSRSRWLS